MSEANSEIIPAASVPLIERIKSRPPLSYKGEAVLTFMLMDELHGRPEGTAKRAFADHKDQLLEDADYFRSPYREWSQWFPVSTDFVLTGLPVPRCCGGQYAREVVLLSKSGYLVLVKSFQDPLAWDVQRMLRDHYFRSESLQTPADMDAYRSIADMISKGISAGLQPMMDRLVTGQTGLSERMQSVEKVVAGTQESVVELTHRQTNFERVLSQMVPRRRPLAAATKVQHRNCVMRYYFGKCPCCQKTDVCDEYGNKLTGAEWEHYSNKAAAQPLKTWLVCRECNLNLLDPDFHGAAQCHFNSYQARREEMVESAHPQLPFPKPS